MAYPNLQILPVSVSSLSGDNSSKKSKRKKKPLPQHTPMNVIRGLLGRGERNSRHRDEDDDDDDREIFRPAYAANIPVLSLPPPVPPPQYVYNPIVNTLAGPPPIDYRQPLYPNPHPQTGGLTYAHGPPHQHAGGPPHPHNGGHPYPPHGPPPLSPLGQGIVALRDTISILRDRPQNRPPPPPPPSPPRYQQPSQSDNNNNNDVRVLS